VKTKTAAAVILYNPAPDMIDNINSYLNQVERLFIIDNSERNNSDLIKSLDTNKLVYVSNNSNIGIAAALNIAAKKAIGEGFEYLLTMDQDSSVSNTMVEEMIAVLEKDREIGILSPRIIHKKNSKNILTQGIESPYVTITSGSIMRLSLYKEVGGFLEKLFIDYVDHEYCLRIRLRNFKVLQLNSVSIFHNLGEVNKKSLLFKKVYPTNHLPLRWYYRTRNRLYIWKEYKKFFPDYVNFDKKGFVKELIKISLYESKKIKKFKMILRGYFDYKKNIFGKYSSVE
jgi:rhamnosyltransferase